MMHFLVSAMQELIPLLSAASDWVNHSAQTFTPTLFPYAYY